MVVYAWIVTGACAVAILGWLREIHRSNFYRRLARHWEQNYREMAKIQDDTQAAWLETSHNKDAIIDRMLARLVGYGDKEAIEATAEIGAYRRSGSN